MLPRLDPNVVYRGVSFLRKLNATQLRGLEGAIVIQSAGSEPLAVIVSVETWQRVQAGFDDVQRIQSSGFVRDVLPTNFVPEREKGDGNR